MEKYKVTGKIEYTSLLGARLMFRIKVRRFGFWWNHGKPWFVAQTAERICDDLNKEYNIRNSK